MKTYLDCLPLDVWHCIAKHLDQRDLCRLSRVNNYYYWLSRQVLPSLIDKEVCVTPNYYLTYYLTLSKWDWQYSVYFSSSDKRFNLADFSSVYEIILKGWGENTDLQQISQVRKLALHFCSVFFDFRKLEQLKYLTLAHQDFRNFQGFDNLRQVYLCECKNLIDVSVLAHIYDVEIHSCDDLRDVSPLRYVHRLFLSDCTKVNDVSALGNVHLLKLCRLGNITDVSMLKTVHKLKLTSLPVVNVNMLGTVKYLKLVDLRSLSDVSGLGTVQILEIIDCPLIEHVFALKTVHCLDLTGLDNVVDVSMLGAVHTLELYDMPNIRNVKNLTTVKKLTIVRCRFIRKRNIKKLKKSVPDFYYSK